MQYAFLIGKKDDLITQLFPHFQLHIARFQKESCKMVSDEVKEHGLAKPVALSVCLQSTAHESPGLCRHTRLNEHFYPVTSSFQ